MNVFFGHSIGVQIGNFITVTGGFVLLLVLIRLFAWKNITAIFDKRADKISGDLAMAEAAKQEADKLVDQRKEQLDDVSKVADKMLLEAKTSGETMRHRIVADAETQANQLKEKAQKDIEKQRQAALAGMKEDVTLLSIELAQEILMKELSREEHSALIDRYLKKLGE
ncbi:F0F1 ATP synthase subunit B [Streptococcus fryi]